MSPRDRSELAAFADAMAHRLATPARIVSGNVRILGPDGLDPDAATALGAIERGSRWIGEIVEGLTRYGRVGDPPEEHERVDAADEARQAIDLLATRIAGSGALIDVAGLPVLDAEPRALRTVFRCLLDNAIRSRPEGPPTIAIACEREASAWHLTISDDGAGVAAEDRERVFEPFVSVADGHASGGAGLGLTLARDMVERHGGEIWLDGREGGGTTVHVVWPDPSADRRGAGTGRAG